MLQISPAEAYSHNQYVTHLVYVLTARGAGVVASAAANNNIRRSVALCHISDSSITFLRELNRLENVLLSAIYHASCR